MKNLISMTDFVLAEKNSTPLVRNFTGFTETSNYEKHSYSRIVKYAEFLSQPLKPEMFIPCDDDGNPLKKPSWSESENEIHFTEYTRKYNQAEEKVLFRGFYKRTYTSLSGEKVIEIYKGVMFNEILILSIINGVLKFNYETIEDLTEFDLELTENALKQIGL